MEYQTVNVLGVGPVRFPADMSREAIKAAIDANMPDAGPRALAEKTGPGEAFFVSAGRKVQSITDGMLQKYLEMTGDTKALEGLATNVSERDRLHAPLEQTRPVATALGAALPSMAMPLRGMFGAAAGGALPELLSYGSDAQRLGRGAAGAAGGLLGYGAGAGVATILKPAGVGAVVNPAAKASAERIGYKPLPGEATGNPALLNIESYLSRGLGSSGKMAAAKSTNEAALDAAASKSIGQQGADIGAGTLATAKNVLGTEFTRLQGLTNPALGADFLDVLVRLDTRNAALGPFRQPAVDSVVTKAIDLAAQGRLTGQAYKEIHTQLSHDAAAAFKGDNAAVGKALKAVREALDAEAGKSLAPAERAAWDKVREQWGNYKTLTKGLVTEGEHVSPARTAAALRQFNPEFRLGGKGLLQDIGRIGETFKGATNPNSGNLTREPLRQVFLAPVNYATAAAYLSPLGQKYMRDGLIDIGKDGVLILKATGVPLGVAASKGLLGAQQ